jgi:hypothetical protein
MENCEIEKRSLEECVQLIVAQNRQLYARIKTRGFRPSVELDFTANGAGVLIRRFFEAVAVYEEGRVPGAKLRELFVTTEELIAALKLRKDAPVCQLDAVGVAFREAAILWRDTHPKPKMPRRVYLKKHFAAEAKIYRRLEELHAEYVRIAAAKGRKTKTLSVAAMEEESSVELDNHRRIFAEIDRLVGLGNSIPRAIKTMMSGTYASRMRGVKASSWKRYYLERKRRRNRMDETVNGAFETVNVPRETVKVENETVNETVKSKNETVKVSSETVKNLIERYPGITGKSLVEFVGKSRATVMRFIAALKAKGHIEYRGSAKTGGYFIPEKLAHKQSGDQGGYTPKIRSISCDVTRLKDQSHRVRFFAG